MADYRQATLADVDGLDEAITSAVEHESSYGDRRPDWHAVLDRIESSTADLDLGTDMTSPVITAILKRARAILSEMT